MLQNVFLFGSVEETADIGLVNEHIETYKTQFASATFNATCFTMFVLNGNEMCEYIVKYTIISKCSFIMMRRTIIFFY